MGAVFLLHLIICGFSEALPGRRANPSATSSSRRIKQVDYRSSGLHRDIVSSSGDDGI